MRRYCLALDLKDDENLIAEYETYHQKVWPDILQSIRSAGIANMEIYRVSNRLFMVMEAEDNFSLEKKAAIDSSSEIVQKWETLMWNYQQALPFAKPGEKWILMNKIFSLNE